MIHILIKEAITIIHRQVGRSLSCSVVNGAIDGFFAFSAYLASLLSQLSQTPDRCRCMQIYPPLGRVHDMLFCTMTHVIQHADRCVLQPTSHPHQRKFLSCNPYTVATSSTVKVIQSHLWFPYSVVVKTFSC